MRLIVSGGYPRESSAEESILDGCEVGITLYDHNELDVEAISGFGPAPNRDDRIQDRW